MAEKKAKLSLPSMQSASKLLSKLLYPVRTHSNFLMMLVALGLLAYSVIMISTIIQQRDDQDYRDKQSANRIKSSFDKDTIQKVDNLKNSSDSSSIDLPAGRRNPFVN
jgi:hypothetical protein